MSPPRIPTRANLALAVLLFLVATATTVSFASAKCLPRNKPEGKEEKPGGAGVAHSLLEKKPASFGGLTTLSVSEGLPGIKKDASDDGAAVKNSNDGKKHYTNGALTTLSVDDSLAEPADSIPEPAEDGTTDDDGATEKKSKRKSKDSVEDEDGEEEQEEKKKKKKSKSKSSDEDDDDDHAKKKSKKKPKNSDDDEEDDAKKKSKKKPKNSDDDEDDKKKSKKKKSKGKSSDEEDDEKPKKKSKSKSKSSDDDEQDEKKSKSESEAAAAEPKEDDGEASASASAPKKEHHAGTMSIPDMIAQPVMHALNPVVKTMCSKTDHADLCESSIEQLPEQPAAQLDDIGVLKLSMNALRAKVQEAINVATDRMGAASADAASKDAMDDCLQMYDDMKSNLDSAEAALKKGDKDTAHTMLDSARTDVDTCEDGFGERDGLKPLMGDLDKILADLSSNTIAIASAISD